MWLLGALAGCVTELEEPAPARPKWAYPTASDAGASLEPADVGPDVSEVAGVQDGPEVCQVHPLCWPGQPTHCLSECREIEGQMGVLICCLDGTHSCNSHAQWDACSGGCHNGQCTSVDDTPDR